MSEYATFSKRLLSISNKDDNEKIIDSYGFEQVLGNILGETLIESYPIIENNIKLLKDNSYYNSDEYYSYGYADMFAKSGSVDNLFDNTIEEDIKTYQIVDSLFKNRESLTDDEVRTKIFKENRTQKSCKFFAKRMAGFNYVVFLIEIDEVKSIHIRQFWEDCTEETLKYDYEYKSAINILKSDPTNFNALSIISKVMSKFSDSHINQYSERPSLQFIIDNGMKYRDLRDYGYICSCTYDDHHKIYKTDGTINLSILKKIHWDLYSLLEIDD